MENILDICLRYVQHKLVVCPLQDGRRQKGRAGAHKKCSTDPYSTSLCAPPAGRQKAKRKGKKRSAAEAGLADDSAEAALAALLAGPYAKSDAEWAGEIDTQCAAVGLLDTVLEVGIGCLVGQDGVCEHRAAKSNSGMSCRGWRAALWLLDNVLEVGIGFLCQGRGLCDFHAPRSALAAAGQLGEMRERWTTSAQGLQLAS